MDKHILVVDDEVNIRESLRRNLRKISNNISTADSAVEALELLKYKKVDIIISDYHMPILDGREFLKIININYPEIKTIILTGKASFDDSISLINQLNLHKFFSKPYPRKEMYEAVEELLNN